MGHGGNIKEISRLYSIKEEDLVDFSANINPLGLCKNVKAKLIDSIDKIEIYPDIKYLDLKKAISIYEEINKEYIIPSNGASEIIFSISKGLNPKKALLIAPTFSEYEESLKAVNCNPIYYNLKEDFILDEDILEALNKEINIVFICNPNNPTGILSNKDLLKRIIEKCQNFNITAVVDESFLDFLEDKNEYSVIRLIEKYKNLIVVKSLTKFFAFPGLRIGYGITSNKLYKEKVEENMPSWSINTLANIGAIEALKQDKYIQKSIDYMKSEKEFLYKELVKINEIKVFKGEVNYILFKYENEIDLKDKLIRKGFLIRSCSNYKNIDKSFYRIAVKKREENLGLIKAIKEVLK